MTTTDDTIRILEGDCRETLKEVPEGSVQTCVTSPPYWALRLYGNEPGQIGQEATVKAYVETMVQVFSLVHKALRPDGTLWLNLGDTYISNGGKKERRRKPKAADTDYSRVYDRRVEAGRGAGIIQGEKLLPTSKGGLDVAPKNLVGIPWRVAFALQEAGWILRQEIIWHKPNPLPEPVKDRCTKSHETIFLFSKRRHYQFNGPAIAEETSANRRSVWTMLPARSDAEHKAVFPIELADRCIRAGSRKGETVLDPFAGTGTTGEAAIANGRKVVLCEIRKAFISKITQRIYNTTPGLGF